MRATVQALVNDHLHAVCVKSACLACCFTFLFQPVLTPTLLTNWDFNMTLITHIVPESQVTFSDHPADKADHPATVPIHIKETNFDVMLVSSEDDASKIVGL